jgi:UDP-N-acetylglucosamine 4-epimerase
VTILPQTSFTHISSETFEEGVLSRKGMDNAAIYPDMHVLITGGAGFIGSNLAEELISKGCSVTVLDNLLTGHIENLSQLMSHPRFTFIEGDIRDFDTCRKAVKGCTHVSHQAALGSVPRSIEDPLLSLHINILGTTNVFFAAKEEGVKRVIFASSSSVYGSDETLPKVEQITGTLLSPYASSKKSTELIQQAFVSCYGMEIIGFRYFNVFGPKQDPNGPYAAVIPKFISMMMDGETPQIYGDGEQSRDFTHINNVVKGNILALITPNISALNGRVLNLAYGGTTTVNDIFYGIRNSLCAHQLEVSNLEPEYMGKRKGDILHSHADISLAEKALGFSPTTDLQTGLNQTIAWYVEKVKR